MRSIFAICICACLIYADNGLRLRGSANDYPVHTTQNGITVATAVIAPAQVRKIFATDLNSDGYVVVEVAVYPEPGRQVDLTAGDFMLGVVSEANSVRPVDARSIAGALARKNSPQRRTTDVAATVGYESGTDPYTGRRVSGVYTGVGVANAPQGTLGPPVQSPDPWYMEQELQDRSLPEAKIAQAVAGYLYFPKIKKSKNAAYQITYYGTNPKLTLVVPPAK